MNSGRVTKPKSTKKTVKHETLSGDEADISNSGSHAIETPADSMFDFDGTMSFSPEVELDYYL